MPNAWLMRPLPIAAVTAPGGGTAAGYDPLSTMNDYMGVVWRSAAGTSSLRLTFDLGAAAAVDAMLFFGCTSATSGMTMTIYGSDDASNTVNSTTIVTAATFLAGATMPVHGRGVGYYEFAASVTRRYWHVDFASIPGSGFSIGRAVIGTRLQLGRNFGFGGAWGVRDLGSVDFSPAGTLLRRQAAKLRTIGLTFSNTYKDEVETKIQPFLQQRAGQNPIALVTDPTIDTLRQTRCWFGPMIGDLGTIWRVANGWEWRANLVDLVPIPKDVI